MYMYINQKKTQNKKKQKKNQKEERKKYNCRIFTKN